jgi:serine/threonine protein kinase
MVTVYPALTDEAARRRFDGAAATAQRLAAHPSVLAVHAWGHGPGGRPWVITDPQPAETVDTVLKTRGPLPAEQALQIGVLVAGALETAHRAGIVHGDLSPARLVFGPQGEPLVADIGLAEFSNFPGFGALHNPIRYYSPPEVLERTSVTAASDVYSLATTVYALLAGRAPHEKPPDITDSNASLLLRILQIEVPPIGRSDVPADLEATLHAALAHAPEKRPLRALDLAWSWQNVQRNAGLTVTEPVVLGLRDAAPEALPPVTAAPPPPLAAPPRVPEGSVPPEVGTEPAWYTDPLPDAPSSPEADLVYLFSETPPNLTDRPWADARATHWATGLDHLSGPQATAVDTGGPWAASTNGHRPNGHVPDAGADAAPDPAPGATAWWGDRDPQVHGLAGRHGTEPHGTGRNGQQPAPRPASRPAIDRAATPPVPIERRPLTSSRSGGPDAFSAGVPIRPGSALDRARQARATGRSRRSAPVGEAAAAGVTTAEAQRLRAPAPTAGTPPALPVIVLIVVVVLLTLGVAYMVITGDDTNDPVNDQPGAASTIEASFDEA